MAIKGPHGSQFWDQVVGGLQQAAHEMHMKAAPLTNGTPRWGGVPERSTLNVWRGPRPESEWRNRQPSGQQLPMFMSTREIEASHQPLDADRAEVEDFDNPTLHRRAGPGAGGIPAGSSAWGEYAASSSSSGGRVASEGSDLPGTATAMSQMRAKWQERGGNFGAHVSGVRTQNGGVVKAYVGERQETNDELWDRKLEEAEEPNYSLHRGPIADDIREHGVKKPITLSTNQFGSEGKPQIVGGHHRMAVMREHDPDALNPVLWAKDIWDAKGSSEYRYT